MYLAALLAMVSCYSGATGGVVRCWGEGSVCALQFDKVSVFQRTYEKAPILGKIEGKKRKGATEDEVVG